MKEVVYNIVKNELNLKERILVKIFIKTFDKIYNIGRINAVNSILN